MLPFTVNRGECRKVWLLKVLRMSDGPKENICTNSSKAQAISQKRERENKKSWNIQKNAIFWARRNQGNRDLTATATTFSESAYHWANHQSITDWGGAHSTLPLTSELLATDRFLGKRRHCLQLHTHWWASQAPIVSSKCIVTQMALVKLRDSKTKQKPKSVERDL